MACPYICRVTIIFSVLFHFILSTLGRFAQAHACGSPVGPNWPELAIATPFWTSVDPFGLSQVTRHLHFGYIRCYSWASSMQTAISEIPNKLFHGLENVVYLTFLMRIWCLDHCHMTEKGKMQSHKHHCNIQMPDLYCFSHIGTIDGLFRRLKSLQSKKWP